MDPDLKNDTFTRPKFYQIWKHKFQCPTTDKQMTFFGGPECVWS